MIEKGEGGMSSGNQNETTIVFPSVAAQKQIAELNVLMGRQKEHLCALTIPENQNSNCKSESVTRQLQQAYKTIEALKQIRSTHVHIKNCLVRDMADQQIEGFPRGYL